MKTEDLLNLISIAKENKLSFLKVGDIEFSFSSQLEPLDAIAEEIEGALKSAEEHKAPVKGADGLTAEEQEALYGTVIDARG